MARLFPCPECGKALSTQFTLNRHITKKHPQSEHLQSITKRSQHRFKCPVCEETCKTFKKFEEHVLSNHNIVLKRELYRITDSASFEKWKSELEQRDSSYFVKSTRAKVCQKWTVHKFMCNRSGFYRCELPEHKRKRSFKFAGSSKIEGFCPAGIRAIHTTKGIVHVEYISTHLGHDIELAHLPVYPEPRKDFASNILPKVANERGEKEEKIDRSKILDRLTMKRKAAYLRKQHVKSLRISTDLIISYGERSWDVVSSAKKPCVYNVKRVSYKCGCKIRCNLCEACTHMFTCTCTVKTCMCIHVHLVCRYLKNAGLEAEVDHANVLSDEYSSKHCDIEDIFADDDIAEDLIENPDVGLSLEEDPQYNPEPELEEDLKATIFIVDHDYCAEPVSAEVHNEVEQNNILKDLGNIVEEINLEEFKQQARLEFNAVLESAETLDDILDVQQFLKQISTKLNSSNTRKQGTVNKIINGANKTFKKVPISKVETSDNDNLVIMQSLTKAEKQNVTLFQPLNRRITQGSVKKIHSGVKGVVKKQGRKVETTDVNNSVMVLSDAQAEQPTSIQPVYLLVSNDTEGTPSQLPIHLMSVHLTSSY